MIVSKLIAKVNLSTGKQINDYLSLMQGFKVNPTKQEFLIVFEKTRIINIQAVTITKLVDRVVTKLKLQGYYQIWQHPGNYSKVCTQNTPKNLKVNNMGGWCSWLSHLLCM